MATKFLKIKSTGSFSGKALQCATLRSENSNTAFASIGVSALNTLTKVKSHLFVFDTGGPNVAESKVFVANIGTANRANNATHAQLGITDTNKTIIHFNTGAPNATNLEDVLDAVMHSLRIFMVRNSVTHIKTDIHTDSNDVKILFWNATQSGLAVDNTKITVIKTSNSTGFASPSVVATSGGSGTYDTFLETEQFDAQTPTDTKTYYLNANVTHVGYGDGVKDAYTHADGTTGKFYSDKLSKVAYILNVSPSNNTKFILQAGDANGDSPVRLFREAQKQINALRTNKHVEFNAPSSDTTVNGASAIYPGHSPADSKFFDEVAGDGLFPIDTSRTISGESTANDTFPAALRGDYLFNRSIEGDLDVSELTPTLIEAGSDLVSEEAVTINGVARTHGTSNFVANYGVKGNKAYTKSKKNIVEFVLPANETVGKQNHILTY